YTAILYHRGMVRWNRDVKVFDDTIAACRAGAYSFLMALGLGFFLKTSVIYSRVLILTLAILKTAVFFLSRLMRLQVMQALKKSELYSKNILIIGAGKIGEQIRDNLMANRSSNNRFIGFLDDYKSGEQILGKIPHVEQLVRKHQI